MEMAALAQEAGLSRAEQEALRDRAVVEDERAYQEDLSEKERQRFNQYVAMSQSDNPDVKALGSYYLQAMGVSARGDVTGNQRAELDAKALEYYNPDFIQRVMGDVKTDKQFESAVERVKNMLDLHYGSVGGAPPDLIDDVVTAMAQEYDRE
jgi:DNA-binding phage protein